VTARRGPIAELDAEMIAGIEVFFSDPQEGTHSDVLRAIATKTGRAIHSVTLAGSRQNCNVVQPHCFPCELRAPIF
jgi:hypothetical protein